MSLSFESIIDDNIEGGSQEKQEVTEDFETILQEITCKSEVVKQEVDEFDEDETSYDDNDGTNEETSLNTSLLKKSDDDLKQPQDEQEKDMVSLEETSSKLDEAKTEEVNLKDLLQVCSALSSLAGDQTDRNVSLMNALTSRSNYLLPSVPNVDSLRCPVCKSLYSTRSALVNHMKVHVRASRAGAPTLGKILCFMCGRHVKNMTLHIRRHLRLYSCFCGRTFEKQAKLEDHFRVHTGERPFQCPICKKCFAVKHNLNTHMKYHEDRRYQCSVCFKKFITQSYLEKHKRKEHFKLLSYDPAMTLETFLASQSSW